MIKIFIKHLSDRDPVQIVVLKGKASHQVFTLNGAQWFWLKVTFATLTLFSFFSAGYFLFSQFRIKNLQEHYFQTREEFFEIETKTLKSFEQIYLASKGSKESLDPTFSSRIKWKLLADDLSSKKIQMVLPSILLQSKLQKSKNVALLTNVLKISAVKLSSTAITIEVVNTRGQIVRGKAWCMLTADHKHYIGPNFEQVPHIVLENLDAQHIHSFKIKHRAIWNFVLNQELYESLKNSQVRSMQIFAKDEKGQWMLQEFRFL